MSTRAVGGHAPARRRVLRRLAVVRRFARWCRTLSPFRARPADAPGTGRPSTSCSACWAGRARSSRTTRTSTPRAPTSSHRRRGGRPGHPRGRRAPAATIRSRATWTSPGWKRSSSRAGPACHGACMVTRHEQLGRRPAGQPREPAGRPRGLRPPRHPAVPRRLPVRRERVLHQDARAGPGGPSGHATSCATCSPRRRDDHDRRRRTGS